MATTGWKLCKDEQHGFSFRYPPDWHSTTRDGRCVQLQKGTAALPDGVPEVDVFVRFLPLQGEFPESYFQKSSAVGTSASTDVSRGVTYSERRELLIGGLAAVRAKFRSSGPTPNWGVEYVVRKDDKVLDIYISQPGPAVEAEFDRVISTLEW